MVNRKTIIQGILGGYDELEEAFAEEWQTKKDDESRLLYNDILDVLIEHRATWQNTLAALEMIRWSYLRAKYLEVVEKTIQVPDGNIPIPKDE